VLGTAEVSSVYFEGQKLQSLFNSFIVTLNTFLKLKDVQTYLLVWITEPRKLVPVSGFSGAFTCKVGFEVLTAVSTKMVVFWVTAPCSLVDVYWRFRGPCCLHPRAITLMMEAARTSDTSVNFYQTTRRCNPEDSHLPFTCSFTRFILRDLWTFPSWI
jgi:hypothetical protein